MQRRHPGAVARVAVRARAQQRLARRQLAVARAVVEGAAARIVGRVDVRCAARQQPAERRPLLPARERHRVVAGRVELSLICCAIAALALSVISRVIAGRRVALSHKIADFARSQLFFGESRCECPWPMSSSAPGWRGGRRATSRPPACSSARSTR